MEWLVDPYRVVSSTKLKNLNICVFYVDIDELNVIFLSIQHLHKMMMNMKMIKIKKVLNWFRCETLLSNKIDNVQLRCFLVLDIKALYFFTFLNVNHCGCRFNVRNCWLMWV
jgi:hypothetical protein